MVMCPTRSRSLEWLQVSLLSALFLLVLARPAAAQVCGGPRLWVAQDGGVARGDTTAYWQCVLGQSNLSELAAAWPSGHTITWGGYAKLGSSCPAINSTGASVGQDSSALQCIINQTHWPVGANDVILYYPSGYGCQDGRNHWGIPVNPPGGGTVNVKAAFVFASTGQECQESMGMHEVYEADSDASAADCCNGQSWTGCSATPGAWGWYSFSACGGTYYGQYVNPVGHEFTQSYCQGLKWGYSNTCATALPQLNGNDTYSFVNWPDGHMELFTLDTSGDMLHVWTNDTADNWHSAAKLDGSATCGSASVMWDPPYNYAELFSPRTDGTTGHLWWSSGGWNTFQPYGGMNLSHLATLTWQDGHSEVFALGSDHALWHDYWNLSARAWSGWASMGGNLATGPAPIRWNDGHGEIFATDAAGMPWHIWSGAYTGGWSPWTMMSSAMPLATRPIPARWADGHVELYATGQDDHLYHSAFGGSWPSFSVLDATTELLGEPSVLMNVAGKGAAAGPEVFARDVTGHVVHLWWSGTAYNTFSPLLDQVSFADPFVWQRSDGTGEVFAVAQDGSLMYLHHTTTAWGTWQSIASGIDVCTTLEPAQAIAPPNTTTAPAAANLVTPTNGGQMAGGCSIAAPDAPETSLSGLAFLLLGLLAFAAVVRRPR